jgi:hypothetical protein
LGVGPPGGGYGTVAAAHGGLKLLLGDLLGQEFSELNLEVSVNEVNVGETELELDVAVVFDQILNSEEDGLEGVINNVFTHMAALGNGNSVGVNHAEALLEDRALGVGGVHFLFAVVTDKMGLETFIDNKARSEKAVMYFFGLT